MDGSSPGADRLDAMLVDAKLLVPPVRPGWVSRRTLVETVRRSQCRVVAVTAPAGYGKSTLLSQWAASEDRGVGWVSLDRFDDDPSAFLSLVASAFARVSGRGDLVGRAQGLGPAALSRAAPLLAAALRTSPSPFVLMLDDAHELRSPGCLDVLGVLISGLPRGSQLVLASRHEQPHLSRLRATGDAVELVAGDLALDAAGAAKVFAATRVDITPDAAAAIVARTEGWPVGVYLAAKIASNTDGDVPMITGDDRFVADYLYREAMLQQPDDVQRFLRRTAVLDQMCASLCEAVSGEEASQARLLGLEASSMFLIPLDHRRQWYRYHGLFREFLLAELRRVEPTVAPQLHRRAADWYEANEVPALALEHLLVTTERDRSVRLAARLLLPTYQSGQLATLERWLATLGRPTVQAYPPLAVLAGWIAGLTGRPAEAERWATFVDTATFEESPVDGTASFASSRAMLGALMCRAGPDQMLADASYAVEHEPVASGWRALALVLRAEAHLLADDLGRATTDFLQTLDVGGRSGNVNAIILSQTELALMAMDRGDWVEAGHDVERALSLIDQHRLNDYAISALTFAAAARLAAHRAGHASSTDSRLARAMRARPTCTFALPWLAVRVRLQLVKTYTGVDDIASAQHLLREIDDIVTRRPQLGVLVDDISSARATLQAKPGRNSSGGPVLTPAELRILPYLQTHLTFREIGERLFVSRNTVNSEVGSIYRKLGVSSRSDAVEHATTIGLLGA